MTRGRLWTKAQISMIQTNIGPSMDTVESKITNLDQDLVMVSMIQYHVDRRPSMTLEQQPAWQSNSNEEPNSNSISMI